MIRIYAEAKDCPFFYGATKRLYEDREDFDKICLISKSSVKEFFHNAELTKIVTKVGDK